MATIQDVAKLAGVSVTTVSRVLNNTAPVSKKTKEKVLHVMDELNYVPSIIAQGMRTKRSRTVAMLIPDYTNSFYHELLKYTEDFAREYGYHVIVESTGQGVSDEITYIRDLLNRNIDGIFVCSYRGDKETVEYLLDLSKKLPIIFMDNVQVNTPIDAVYADGYDGVKKVVSHLAALGHREIAFIKSLTGYKVANDRYRGYIDAIKEAGLSFSENMVYEGGNYHIKSGYDAARFFLEGNSIKPTAIAASNDFMAIGAMNYLKTLGLKIPEDIAVAGFDDIYMSKLMSPPLTTYRQPIEAIAREAVKLFISKINQSNAGEERIVLKGDLIIRRSTDAGAKEVEVLDME